MFERAKSRGETVTMISCKPFFLGLLQMIVDFQIGHPPFVFFYRADVCWCDKLFGAQQIRALALFSGNIYIYNIDIICIIYIYICVYIYIIGKWWNMHRKVPGNYVIMWQIGDVNDSIWSPFDGSIHHIIRWQSSLFWRVAKTRHRWCCEKSIILLENQSCLW